MKIIVDTREKQNKHIIDYFEKNNIYYLTKKLDYGDYANEDLSVVIERKGSLDEISQNITKYKKRFEKEFWRAKKSKMIVIIEGASWEDIKNHNYRSKLNPKGFESILNTFQNKFMFELEFVEKSDAGRFIAEKLMKGATLSKRSLGKR